MRARIGVVRWVDYQQDSKDYEVLVLKSWRSPWWFGFDHLERVLVDSGATVVAGQPIGIVRAIDGTAARKIGFVKLMVGDDRTKPSYCPFDYLMPSEREPVREAIDGLMQSWRARGNDRPDTTGQVSPACYAHTAVP